ncbi:MAG TPA: protein kinase [Pyrinomonadaceae bacterium]|jgi:serine/threonine-protein kinase|nr:protein kinase [Pyrinomonadaceae bacterium]
MKLCAACNNTFADTETFCPHDGEVLQESPENIVGQVIEGKYKVESFIAQGGMGAVYRARHILLGDQVVIKTLRSEMRGNAEWLKRFQREGKAARAFRHPNSVTVYDLSAGSDGMIYMVMEYVEGHTLDKELKRRGCFTPAEALDVLEPVADVLDAAHARGVVHRDLKPENIMLGHEDRGGTVVKVLDLGIAKIVGAGDVHAANATSLTVAGQILGTPYYMSPEQWGEMPRDGNPEVDGRTDIYSLGVIFFELVAGRRPLGGRTLSELRQKHVAEPLPSLSDIASGVPAEFSRGVAHAMAKDRADRPQTAGELVGELRSALGLEPSARARVTHATGAGAILPTDARGARGTSAQGRDVSEAATANLSPGARPLERSHADTILTSEFESPVAGRGRETVAQSSQSSTGGNASARRESGRETLVSQASETQAGATGDARQQQTVPETRVAFGREESQPGAGRVVTAPVPRRSLAPFVAVGVLALLIVAGVGGWLAWRSMQPKPPGVFVAQPTPAPNPAAPAKPADAPKAEAASYWFEAFDKPEDAAGKRVAETATTLVSGQRFRFHFMPQERGYLYIIGPGAGGNAQVTILTAQGAGPLKSNLVGAGADFAFPSMNGAKLKLDDTPGSDEFTFIFSPTPLMSPSFLTGKFLHELTPAEVKELEDFRAQFKSDAPAVAVKDDGGERRVAVSAPQAATSVGKPVIFDVRINHR